MQILIVGSSNISSTYGGGQVYVKNLVDELINQGQQVIIASPAEKTGKLASYKGADMFSFKFDHFQKDTAQLENFISEIKPEIVHLHGFKALFSKACKKLEIPVVTTAHHGGILCPVGSLLNYKDEICKVKASPENCLKCVLHTIRGGKYGYPLMQTIGPSLGKKIGETVAKFPRVLYASPVLESYYSIAKKMKEWKMIHESSDLLIAPSNAIAESMILNGCEKDKIKVVPHGIHLPDQKLPNKRQSKNRSGVTKFFFLGRINHVKGVHILCQAFDEMVSKAELHIVGGTGNKQEEKYLYSLKKRFIHNKSIYWHGKIQPESVPGKIQEYDIMVNPTLCLEVFGLNIAEALSMGKPVIATRCGGAEMQIADSINGLLVEPKNVNDLRTVMESSLNYPFSLTEFLKKVNSIENHVLEVISIYRSLKQSKAQG